MMIKSNLKICNMKRKIYLIVIAGIACLGGLYSQDTLHVGESLYQKIQGAADGTTIIIKSGIHNAQAQEITITNKSLTIKGEGGEEKPLVYVEEFDVSGTDVDIILEGIEFSGATYDSLTGENTTDLEATYLINLLDGHTSCNNIIIRNCIVRNFKASAIRGDRSTNTADSIIIDNCVMYDFRGGSDYGAFRFKDDITINAFIIKNSTLYNFLNKLVDVQDVVPSQMDITVENCTFYNWGGGKTNQYLFDIQDNVQARLYVKSCILGKTNSELVTVKAFRFPPVAGLNYAEISNTVMAPDFVVDTMGAYDRVAWDKDEWNYVDYDPEFEDPENGLFYIPEGSDIWTMSPTGGPIGDPRWCVEYSDINKVFDFNKIQLYPVPSGTILNIKTDEPGLIVIYNALGIKVTEFKIKDTFVHTIDISGFAPGLYLIRLNDNPGARKFLIK